MEKKIAVVGGGQYVGSIVASLMAMAGSALPILTEPERLYPPKTYPPHTPHQGAKECQRRLKRMRRP